MIIETGIIYLIEYIIWSFNSTPAKPIAKKVVGTQGEIGIPMFSPTNIAKPTCCGLPPTDLTT